MVDFSLVTSAIFKTFSDPEDPSKMVVIHPDTENERTLPTILDDAASVAEREPLSPGVNLILYFRTSDLATLLSPLVRGAVIRFRDVYYIAEDTVQNEADGTQVYFRERA